MRMLIISLLLAVTLAATGCMQMEMATEIAKDGSGIFHYVMSIPTDVEEALAELSAMEGGMGDEMDEMPDFKNFDKKEFEKKLSKYDVKLKSFSNEVADAKRTVVLDLAFGNFEGLQAAMALLMGGSEDAIGIERMDDGNYLLSSTESTIDFGDEEAEEPQEQAKEPSMEDMQAAMANAGKSMELMGKLMAHSSELAMTMKITLPGDVIEHNAPKLEGRTCVWEINSENMMQMESMDPRIIFDGKGVNIK
ncbi:hypothetical protein H8E07_14975 [bacterium]|nr:hypothetical protein [bacterium]